MLTFFFSRLPLLLTIVTAIYQKSYVLEIMFQKFHKTYKGLEKDEITIILESTGVQTEIMRCKMGAFNFWHPHNFYNKISKMKFLNQISGIKFTEYVYIHSRTNFSKWNFLKIIFKMYIIFFWNEFSEVFLHEIYFRKNFSKVRFKILFKLNCYMHFLLLFLSSSSFSATAMMKVVVTTIIMIV